MVPAMVAVIADAARAVIGPDDPAAVRVIVIRRVAVKARTEVMPVREPVAAIAKRAVAITAAAEHTTGAKPAATEHAAAADFGGQSVRKILGCRNSPGIAQRQRFSALARRGRQRQQRGSRKAQGT